MINLNLICTYWKCYLEERAVIKYQLKLTGHVENCIDLFMSEVFRHVFSNRRFLLAPVVAGVDQNVGVRNLVLALKRKKMTCKNVTFWMIFKVIFLKWIIFIFLLPLKFVQSLFFPREICSFDYTVIVHVLLAVYAINNFKWGTWVSI